MKKEYTIENWILGGTSFILIFTLGCYVWYQSQMSSIDNYFNDPTEKTQQINETSEKDELETPLIEINDNDNFDNFDRDSSEIELNDTELSNVSATKGDNIESNKPTVYVPLGNRSTVLKIFGLNS